MTKLQRIHPLILCSSSSLVVVSVNICHIASCSAPLRLLSPPTQISSVNITRCSVEWPLLLLWRVANKLFWIFCGRFGWYVYIHPPTYLLGQVNSLSGLVCECLYICVYFSFLRAVCMCYLCLHIGWDTVHWSYFCSWVRISFPLPFTLLPA